MGCTTTPLNIEGIATDAARDASDEHTISNEKQGLW